GVGSASASMAGSGRQPTRREATMAGEDRALVLAPGEGRAIDLGPFGMTVKASWDETDGVFSLLEAEEPPGFGPPLHIHHDAAEAFYVLEGEYVMFLDDREVSCPAGSFVFIPAGMRHGFRVGAALIPRCIAGALLRIRSPFLPAPSGRPARSRATLPACPSGDRSGCRPRRRSRHR